MSWIAATLLAAAVALVVFLTPGVGSRREVSRAVESQSASNPRTTSAPPASESTVETATFTDAKAAMPRAAALPPSSAAPPAAASSPLQRSPGYYPPADPESASVRLGRREAPVVPYLFEGGAGSLDDFGRQVVAALSAQDEPALHSLRVAFPEFAKILWREFPESRPVTNIQAEDAWSLSEPRSHTAVNRATGLYGGRRLRFLTVEVGRVQAFTNFILHRDVRILAVDEATARIERIELAPSVAERNGRFKALLYRD